MTRKISRDELAQIAQKAIEAFGGGAKLAAVVGIRKEAIQGWKRSGIPPTRAQSISQITGIPLHELRPDVYPDAAP